MRPTLRARRIQDFNRRRELLFGFFMTEVDLEVRASTPLGLLMGGLPGTKVTGGLRPTDPYVIEHRGDTCWPTVWVDGRKMISVQDALASIRANQIEALEIYRGGEAPAEFNADGGCVTLILWTR